MLDGIDWLIGRSQEASDSGWRGHHEALSCCQLITLQPLLLLLPYLYRVLYIQYAVVLVLMAEGRYLGLRQGEDVVGRVGTLPYRARWGQEGTRSTQGSLRQEST